MSSRKHIISVFTKCSQRKIERELRKRLDEKVKSNDITIDELTEAPIRVVKSLADSGSSLACYVLFLRYKNGDGVKQNATLASKYFDKALKLIPFSPPRSLSDYDDEDDIDDEDDEDDEDEEDEEDLSLYTTLDDEDEEQNEAERAEEQYQMGLRYETGDNVEQDLQMAVRYYNLAAINGHQGAKQALIAIEYIEQFDDNEKD